MFTKIFATIVVAILLPFPHGDGHLHLAVSAQDSDPTITGKLIYITQDAEIITLTNQQRLVFNARQVFNASPDFCWGYSNDGSYVAATTMSATSMIIRRIDNQMVVADLPWQQEWEPCSFFWRGDAILSIRSKGTSNDTSDYDVEAGEFIDSNPPPYSPPPFPDLPGGSPELFYFPSPDRDVVLYERCLGELTVNVGGETGCSEYPDLVIYDLTQQQIIGILQDAFSSHLNCCPPGNPGNVSWSPTGRYLAYERSLPPPGVNADNDLQFRLQVYDTDTRQYLDTHFNSVFIDQFRGFTWSPDGAKLAFWILGGTFDQELPEDSRQLIIYCTQTMEYTRTDAPYLAPTQLLWSLDSRALAFLDSTNNLIYVDTITGTTTTLDMNINRIIIWEAE